MNFLAGRFFVLNGILRRAHLVVLASNCAALDTLLRLLVVAIPMQVVARKFRFLLRNLKLSMATGSSRSTTTR